MSIYDILAGKKPLLRSTRVKQFQREIEAEFTALMNRQSANNERRLPKPLNSVMVEDQVAQDDPVITVSGRYTLNPNSRIKVLDTDGKKMNVYITVPGQGQVAYATHDPIRILSRVGGVHEGIPLTNNPNVAGRPTPNHLQWIGQMWLTGDTVNMVVDVEAS